MSETPIETEFKLFLEKKKIDAERFEAAEPERFAEWMVLFSSVSPESFVQQKLYLINPVRRQYGLEPKPRPKK